MDGQVSPASHRGPTDPPPGQEMAEGRSTRGWSVVGNEKGDSARLGDFTAALQRLLTLRLRPLGPALADASSYGRGHRGSLCGRHGDRKSTRLNSSHTVISYAVFCLKKKK